MTVLSNCKPMDVFKYFEEICNIPHGSWNEKALSDHIHRWALDLGLDSVQDKLYNLIIRKPAAAGYEAAPTVILQGHIDMVCEKNADVEFDFAKDPLDIYVDGDYIKARGTTLGADNGIATAMAMAILADKTLSHPALEVVLTTVEEAGMDGAKAIDGNLLKGRYFINMDSEDEGTFLASCAGGARVMVKLDIKWENIAFTRSTALKIFVSGLKGGHSGMDINKGRANSNKILGRLLDVIKTPWQLAEIGGGSKDNAIPREAWANIVVAATDAEAVKLEIDNFGKIIAAEFEHSDPDISVTAELIQTLPTRVFANDAAKKTVGLLLSIPCGVAHMSATLSYLVETSNNLGVVRLEEDTVVFTNAVRSSSDSRRRELIRCIYAIGEAFGAKCHSTDGYPGWQYNPNSPLRDIFQKVYKEKFGKDSQILAIHAGLECGLFAEKIPGLDMISFGPNMHDVHTPQERISIQSTANSYEFLKDVLAVLKD